jgi:superfamily II helicase
MKLRNLKRAADRSQLRKTADNVETLRKQYDLCPHAADARGYATEAEADADTREAEVCAMCNRKRLITAIINPNFAQEVYQDVPTQLAAKEIARKLR